MKLALRVIFQFIAEVKLKEIVLFCKLINLLLLY